MKIGVVSDTHIPFAASSLPTEVIDRLKGCDLIIHAGDIVEMSVLDQLGKIAETRAVRGNMDNLEVKKKLPETILLDVEGKKIGVVHGHGPGFKALESAREAFKTAPDIIIFGHSHDPVNKVVGGTLFFNPGSPTDTVFTKYRSFGIIEIRGGEVKAEIIRLDD